MFVTYTLGLVWSGLWYARLSTTVGGNPRYSMQVIELTEKYRREDPRVARHTHQASTGVGVFDEAGGVIVLLSLWHVCLGLEQGLEP